MKYDVFLSYKSEDHAWVENLKISLQKRGVVVWLDKDAIRPGDLFAQALEDGIKDSGAIAIIVTPRSMKSRWAYDAKTPSGWNRGAAPHPWARV